jgi:hypothetical protein
VAQSQPAAGASVSAPADVLTFPTGFMKSIADYGAIANDGIDDTAAIQKALDEDRRDVNGNSIYGAADQYTGRPKALAFEAGTYDVSDTLDWTGSNVTLQGKGDGVTIIRLRDNASGFNDAKAPKAVIETEYGNMSFDQYIRNLTVNTGKNNPGAIGIDYISNNTGTLSDVTIKSEDGQGFTGLAMERPYAGPSLVKNVRIEGFDYGIRTSYTEYGPTFEHITLKNQNVAGIHNLYAALSIRGLNSTNSVPVIQGSSDAGMVTLVDANLQGGAANVSAIQTQGEIYMRNVTTSGYQSAVQYRGNVVPGTTQTEYSSLTYQAFDDSAKQSLNLPIKETPEYYDNNMNNWGRFEAKNYGETHGLQELLNSGKSTIYFDFNKYLSYNETVVKVPATVKHITGFSSIVNTDGNGKNGGGIKFVVEENSSDPLIIEDFSHGIKVEHNSPRTVAIKHGQYQYTSNANAGELFLEDVNIEPLTIQPKQNVWARQLNNEYGGTKIVNDGGNLWILGLKTERAGTVIESINGANTELLGGVIQPAGKFSAEDKQKPAFVTKDSSASLSFRTHAYDPAYYYDTQVEETRNGEKRQKLTNQMSYLVPLFTAYKK